MDCDSKIGELLPWYVNGTLKGDEKKKVEEHLKVCSKCQRELAQAKWLFDGVKKYGDVLLTGHVDSQKLVIYVDSPGDLRESERLVIESHLKGCSHCTEELKLLQESRKEFEKSTTFSETEVPFGARVTDWLRSISYGLSWLVRRPALAYVACILVLLLSYPAYLGLFRAKPETPTSLPPIIVRSISDKLVLDGKDLIVADQTRATGFKIPEIVVDSTINILHLKIPYPIDTSFTVNYEVKITDSTGLVIWADNDWRRYGIAGEERFWIFELNPALLPTGLLDVRIRGHEPGQVSQMPAAIYQFRLNKNK